LRVGPFIFIMDNHKFILSEIQLRYTPKVPALQRPKIICAEDAYQQFLLLMDQTQFNIREEAAVLFLNRNNRILGGFKLSIGGITGTVLDIRLILSSALKSLSSAIFIAHSHPSGNLTPSKSDIDLTIRLREAAKLMDIILLDHLILTRETYLSMAAEGLI
jgi:DNA repair protein RadC